MSRLLYVQASPRTKRSRSRQVADAFVEAYRQGHPDDEIAAVNIFEKDLPAFDGLAVQAKYTILHGQQHSAEELAAWKEVERVIEEFTSADKYLLAVPMWNFGIPYRLKQYFDILVQPGYTFSYSPEEGYSGLVTGKPAVVCYARGGDYSAPETASLDLQKPYLDLILGFMGITDVRTVVAQPMLMAGPEVSQQKLAEAIAEARKIAQSF